MKLETLQKLTDAMKEIAPAIEKNGFIVAGIVDNSNSSWEHLSIKILPRPEPGSCHERILKGEGITS